MCGSRTSRNLAVALATVTVVFGLRMIPATPSAQAGGLCSVPVISIACSVVSGVESGVSWTFDTGSSVITFGGKIVGKVLQKVSGPVCMWAKADQPELLLLKVAMKHDICQKILDWAAKKIAGGGGGKPPAPGTAGGGTAPPTTTTTPAASSDPPDTPAHYLSTSALAAGAALMMGTIGSEIGKATSVDVTGGWFASIYGRAVALASGIMLIAFLLACLEGSVRSDSAMLLLALQGLPRAAILGAAGAVFIGAGIAFTDQAGVAVAGPDMQTATHALHLLALAFVALGLAAKGAAGAGHGTLASILGTPAALFAGFAFLASLAMVLELTVRAVGIYAAALFVPVVLAASVWPRFHDAPKRLAVTLTGIVAAKFVLVCVLALSAGAMTGGGVRGIAVGCGLLLIACVAPWVFYRFFTVADHHFTRSTVVPSGSLGGSAAMLSSIAFRSEQVSRAHGVASPASQSPQSSGERGSQSGGEASAVRVQPPRTIDTQRGRETPEGGEGE
jgi:hypothetical protein